LLILLVFIEFLWPVSLNCLPIWSFSITLNYFLPSLPCTSFYTQSPRHGGGRSWSFSWRLSCEVCSMLYTSIAEHLFRFTGTVSAAMSVFSIAVS
jgi:hypothetical protein